MHFEAKIQYHHGFEAVTQMTTAGRWELFVRQKLDQFYHRQNVVTKLANYPKLLGHRRPESTKKPMTDAKMAKTNESAAHAKHLQLADLWRKSFEHWNAWMGKNAQRTTPFDPLWCPKSG